MLIGGSSLACDHLGAGYDNQFNLRQRAEAKPLKEISLCTLPVKAILQHHSDVELVGSVTTIPSVIS